MTLQELLKQYINKEKTAVETVRIISAAFDPHFAIDMLALINQICRHEVGDMDTDILKSMYGIE